MSEKGLTLYDIAEAYERLGAILESGDGEELKVYLDAIEGQLEEKVTNVVRFSKNLELTAEAIYSEIARLEELKKKYVSKSQSLRNYIAYVMQRFDIPKVDSVVASVSFRKSRTVEIDDVALLPEKFIVVKTSKLPDKKAIKEAIDHGDTVPGAHVEEHQNLQIK